MNGMTHRELEKLPIRDVGGRGGQRRRLICRLRSIQPLCYILPMYNRVTQGRLDFLLPLRFNVQIDCFVS